MNFFWVKSIRMNETATKNLKNWKISIRINFFSIEKTTHHLKF